MTLRVASLNFMLLPLGPLMSSSNMLTTHAEGACRSVPGPHEAGQY